MPEGDEEHLLSTRADFMKSLGLLAEHLESRVVEIRESMEAAASRNDGRSKLFEEIWRPKLDGLAHDIQEFRRRSATNPTLCVMGKRGQGKTSLLRKWLAGDVTPNDDNNPLAAILDLPSGSSDTTAALVRLRSVKMDDPRYDPSYLYCSMLEERHLAHLTNNRPPAPPLDSLRVARLGKKAYWVCRFPCEKEETGHTLAIDSTGVGTVVATASGSSLASVQWHAREVLVPVDLTHTPSVSFGARTLAVLDVIDAPGADAAMQKPYEEWKREKNGLVFKAAIRELDVLFLIASADVAAVQLGGQFQKEIWWEWLERCRDDRDMAGRLVLAFTNAARLFDAAEKRISSESSHQNDVSDFANLICKNVLEQLAPHPDGVPQLLRAKDPRTWPPMFFFEQDNPPMARFREGIVPGSGRAFAEKILDRLFATPEGSIDDLPLGAKCVYVMARDLMTSEHIASTGRKSVARWIVGALCQLLDPTDRGYAALTETIHDYATGGPVARNHAGERARDADRYCDRFRCMLVDLATPAGNQKAIHDLEIVQTLIRKYWTDYPEGPRLHRGSLCRQRRDQIRENREIIVTSRHLINHDMVLEDVARDTVEQLKSNKQAWTRDEADIVARVIHACLKGDAGLQEMARQYAQAIDRDYETLYRIQTVALERTVRVLDFLVRADKTALDLIASHCFKIDLNEAELVGELRPDVVKWTVEDEARLSAVYTAHNALIKVIDRIPCIKPYETDNA